MIRFRRFSLCAGLLALFFLTAQGQLLAETLPDMVLIEENATITATVGEEDGEGLWVVTSDGTNYSVWTPEDVTLEDISSFQQNFKNKEVTLKGAVYKDKYDNLNLFVKSLPK